MANRVRLHAIADRNHVPIMPFDIINEDEYLDHLARSEDAVAYLNEAYALAHPLGTFQDWYMTLRRIVRGRQQLKERYPLLADKNGSLVDRNRHRLHEENTGRSAGDSESNGDDGSSGRLRVSRT